MIWGAFSAALGQLGDRAFRRALFLGVGLAVALLVGLALGLSWALGWLIPDRFTLPFVGAIGGIDTAVSVAALLAMLGLSVFLMVPVAGAMTGLFLETVADAVEAHHYPGLPPAPGAPFWPTVWDSLRFFVVLTILSLVGAVVTLATGGTGIVLVWLINGYLLSREYFTLVALRRLDPDEAHALRRQHFSTLWLAGVMMAIPLSVPLVNLMIPVLGAATFTHLFHRLPR